MAENSSIEWCMATFNPWIGCTKVNEACRFCYAEADFDLRRHFAKWGPRGTRVKTSDANWKKPLKWNRAADGWRDCMGCGHYYRSEWKTTIAVDACPNCGKLESVRRRPRVFCASLADVFEEIGSDHVIDHRGRPIYRAFPEVTRTSNDPADHYRVGLDHLRRDLFALIDATPNLDWLLLTKRPENIRRMWPYVPHTVLQEPYKQFSGYRKNVWLGTSISDQATADAMLPELLKCRDLTPVLFASYEPALGPVDFGWALGGHRHTNPKIDWLIVGGESGHHARPFDIAWARSAVEQCKAAAIPVFCKQLGAVPMDNTEFLFLEDKKGGNIQEWPEDLRVRQLPEVRT